MEKTPPRVSDADSSEKTEQDRLRAELKKSDSREDASWRVKTDKAAFGREPVPMKDRWY